MSLSINSDQSRTICLRALQATKACTFVIMFTIIVIFIAILMFLFSKIILLLILVCCRFRQLCFPENVSRCESLVLTCSSSRRSYYIRGILRSGSFRSIFRALDSYAIQAWLVCFTCPKGLCANGGSQKSIAKILSEQVESCCAQF